MKLKKGLVKFVSLALCSTMLVACGGSNAASSGNNAAGNTTTTDQGAPGETPVTIRFSWWGGDSRHEATQKAVDAFMDKYPNITVETEFGAWSGWEEKCATQLMSNNAPDLMQINWNWINSYSSDGSKFTDLNQVSDIIDFSQWNQNDLDQCKVGDNLQAIPLALTGRIFYWNQTTFEKAGLTTPTTFEELMAAGPIFKEKLGDGAFPLVMGEYDRMIFVVYYLESVYGKPWVTDNVVNYTADEIQEALDLLAKMEEDHVIPTIKKIAGDGADSLDKNQNWIDGNYAGILEWDSSATKFIKAAPNSTIVVGDFFTDLGSYQGGFTKVSMGFAIPSSSKYPKEAALLLEFLTNDETGIELMASERGVPASMKALEVTTSKGLLDASVAEANGKVMDWCQFTLDPKFEDNALKGDPDGVYYKIMEKVSYGEMTTADGAASMLQQINDFLAK